MEHGVPADLDDPLADVAYVYLIAAFFTHILAWLSVVILGRYPLWLYDFNSGIVRYLMRFYAFASLQTDEWPPFGIGEDDVYPIRAKVAPAATLQSRLKAFFRLVLVLPMVVVAYAVNYVHLGGRDHRLARDCLSWLHAVSDQRHAHLRKQLLCPGVRLQRDSHR